MASRNIYKEPIEWQWEQPNLQGGTAHSMSSSQELRLVATSIYVPNMEKETGWELVHIYYDQVALPEKRLGF